MKTSNLDPGPDQDVGGNLSPLSVVIYIFLSACLIELLGQLLLTWLFCPVDFFRGPQLVQWQLSITPYAPLNWSSYGLHWAIWCVAGVGFGYSTGRKGYAITVVALILFYVLLFFTDSYTPQYRWRDIAFFESLTVLFHLVGVYQGTMQRAKRRPPGSSTQAPPHGSPQSEPRTLRSQRNT